jgi:hypothetical protein
MIDDDPGPDRRFVDIFLSSKQKNDKLILAPSLHFDGGW